ncbi:SDR family oxidoreductase [Sphingomonas histidinilytica]|jgi:meso-butanediol dehydrogenase/(S,S)-butanediol dehydrogenase/diacetyl reductase|uniref:Meso-butanediol dehydrogenase / (S,S)-butanediol dehydrogenase / diacetyl reductase n=1 Tax=Rhizorhabdus histidinilytica TaxID=439228 RepID=A0A1T5GAT7_9SPHN|nr:SDR family NAD(P)-dependent oxidoreductase [Rhizorhabdus histidinilytica]MBO9379922.1 SDR family oxidoreductase [Rhizorhabdus histidinilytica]QEH77107.1 SDR family oxidoreductase [Sphingomonas sp. C8-2]SKC05482.1 meso-butanediol dehydrogenase / (S,S)-butanediol dehydrogenase / diacetyl reductase [Rhizorhabdus histidinilytica]
MSIVAGRFAGRAVIVVGGASGIGAATVSRLRAEGARVWIADRVEPDGGDTLFIRGDITSSDDVDRAIETVEATAPLDVLVNCAGLPAPGTAAETDDPTWQRLIDVNLSGAFRATRAALRVMQPRRSGSIVHVASDAGLVGMAGQAAYCAGKGGLVHFVRAAALDAAPHGVRINCVAPCFVDTPMMRAWIAGQADPVAARADIDAEQPIGRVGQPEEIAAAIAFLASHEANFVTGVALPVDGGVTAR